MSDEERGAVAIVDYGLGNMFSLMHACEQVGIDAFITDSAREISEADGVILPGVGAFGDGMECLRRLDLVAPLQSIAESTKPLVGICLGMQLMMTESFEFGKHKGLDIIEGTVVRLSGAGEDPHGSSEEGFTVVKVPQVGWNRIYRTKEEQKPLHGHGIDEWECSPLQGLVDGEHMYFVHSFYAKPEDSSVVLSLARYGRTEFCSSMWRDNIVGFQFHPERSGPRGLDIYRNLAQVIRNDV